MIDNVYLITIDAKRKSFHITMIWKKISIYHIIISFSDSFALDNFHFSFFLVGWWRLTDDLVIIMWISFFLSLFKSSKDVHDHRNYLLFIHWWNIYQLPCQFSFKNKTRQFFPVKTSNRVCFYRDCSSINVLLHSTMILKQVKYCFQSILDKDSLWSSRLFSFFSFCTIV